MFIGSSVTVLSVLLYLMAPCVLVSCPQSHIPFATQSDV